MLILGCAILGQQTAFFVAELLSRVLTILVPAAFFAGLNSSFTPPGMVKISVVSDRVRHEMLVFSRGLAILLIIV
jgi:hypothetical protein